MKKFITTKVALLLFAALLILTETGREVILELLSFAIFFSLSFLFAALFILIFKSEK